MMDKNAATKEQKAQELIYWKQWKDTGDKEAFEKLLDLYQKVIAPKVNKFTYTSSVPKAYMQVRAYKHFTDALSTYDPKQGADLSTHVNWRLKKLSRDYSQYALSTRIPEKRIHKVNPFQNAKGFLEERLGREPTTLELSEELGWSMGDVENLSVEIRKGLISESEAHQTISRPNPMDDKVQYVYLFQASPEEKLILEYLFGLGGKEKLKNKREVASKLRWPIEKVNKLANSLAKKIEGM